MASHNSRVKLRDFKTVFDEINTDYVKEIPEDYEDIKGLRIKKCFGNYRVSIERRDFPQGKKIGTPGRHDYWLSVINEHGEAKRSSDYRAAIITYIALVNHVKRITNSD
jgi:hypothetical protein